MNRLYLLFCCIFFMSLDLPGQFECGTEEYMEKTSTLGCGSNTNSNIYIPDSNDPVKIIRVNIHFMLKDIGDPDYPGNYTKYDDGK